MIRLPQRGNVSQPRVGGPSRMGEDPGKLKKDNNQRSCIVPRLTDAATPSGLGNVFGGHLPRVGSQNSPTLG